MLSEARALVEAPYFPAVRDLFLEQIALCGFEGFGEFGPKNWRKKVRRWQNKKGCFEQSLFHVDCSSNDSSKFVKRTDSIVDDCHTHLTSVALAAMAFHLRIILNSAFFSVTKN